MKILPLSQERLRLGQLGAHLVVALITLIVIGGATRVMEAGLACPDWPLCFGSFLPGKQMNLQVFLEWFHRLDAFLVGIALIIQFLLSIKWRMQLPMWLPWVYGGMVILIGVQGGLGALTVLDLLPSFVVIAHLVVALTLVSFMSAITQLLVTGGSLPPGWWRGLGFFVLFSLVAQSLVGSRMATSWAAQRCLNFGESCYLLDLHRTTAIPVTFLVLLFLLSTFFLKGWVRNNWLSLVVVFLLISLQVFLGILSVKVGLEQPLLVISHQLIAALLVSSISALIFKGPSVIPIEGFEITESKTLEACHG